MLKNIQIFDRAENATFSIFQATDEEFAAIFPDGRDMELIEDLVARLEPEEVDRIFEAVWMRPIRKQDVQGLHGSLFYEWSDRRHHIPDSKREIDVDSRSIKEAQRALFASLR